MDSLNSQLQQIADNNFTNTKNYLSELANSKANESLSKLNAEIEKVAGIQNLTMQVGGLYLGGKGLYTSGKKAYDYYTDKFKSGEDNPADLKDNVNNIKKENLEDFDKEAEPIEDIDYGKEEQQVESQEEENIGEEIDLDKPLDDNELLNHLNNYKPTFEKDETDLDDTPEGETWMRGNERPVDLDQIREYSYGKPKPNVSEDLGENVGKDIGEDLGEDTAGGLGIGETIAQFIPGVDVVADLGMLGFLGYQVGHQLHEAHKQQEDENAYEKNVKNVNDISNMTNTFTKTFAPNQSQQSLLSGGETSSF